MDQAFARPRIQKFCGPEVAPWVFLVFVSVSYFLPCKSFANRPDAEGACTKIDMSSRFGDIRDQGSSPYCYAFAAADLIGEALGVAPPDLISAFDVAVHSISLSETELLSANSKVQVERLPGAQNDIFEKLFSPTQGATFKNIPLYERSGGFAATSVAALLDRGYVCLEREVRSQSLKSDTAFLPRILNENDGRPPKTEARGQSCDTLCLLGRQTAPLNLMSDLEPLGAISDWASLRLRKLNSKSCKGPITFKGFQVHSEFYPGAILSSNLGMSSSKRKNPEAEINRLLERGRPFGLTYETCRVLGVCPGGDHVSVVVGREVRGGVCKIKIKNSWGQFCPKHDPKVECADGYWWAPLTGIENIHVTYVTEKRP